MTVSLNYIRVAGRSSNIFVFGDQVEQPSSLQKVRVSVIYYE